MKSKTEVELENAKLREALERIKDWTISNADPELPRQIGIKCREALGAVEGKDLGVWGIELKRQ